MDNVDNVDNVVAAEESALSEQARDALLQAIINAAPTMGNSPAGIRDLAEAYALVRGWLEPNAGVVRSRT